MNEKRTTRRGTGAGSGHGPDDAHGPGHDDPGAVGRRVQRLRAERGLTQRQLAEPSYTPAYV
ncbi:hypothetical protein ACFU9X_37125, partial [Streptomyces atratus]